MRIDMGKRATFLSDIRTALVDEKGENVRKILAKLDRMAL
jgi:hypothetical protein